MEIVRETIKIAVVSSSITRPANETQYAAGDVISAVTSNNHHTFTGTSRAGASDGECRIVEAICISDGNATTKPDLELWLFSADITKVADNAAFAPTDAEMATLIGIITFPVASWVTGHAGATMTGNQAMYKTGLDIRFNGAMTTIYGQIVVRNTYTPLTSETFTVVLKILQ